MTERMIIPDFQSKLGVQGCRIKVCGGLCGELPVEVLAWGAGAERVLCTGGMATSHKPPQPYTSLWIRPVDNSAHDVMKPPVPACRRAAVGGPEEQARAASVSPAR